MAFTPKKYNDLFEDMRNRTPASVLNDFEVGSVTRTLYETFAYELALLYEKMNLVYLSAFVDTARGNQLDQVVAILGIQRGLPDYSVGSVMFIRDLGKEDIQIPLGTLVATEESEENPKKVYQTIEEKILAQDQTTINLRVQAFVRGEDQDTGPETVTVMPRPIPGIKSVINNEAIALIGKQRETDEELRERAKNALISSGKASVIAIENTLLALQEVVDVKIQEDYRFASGKVLFERSVNVNPRLIIPKGTAILYTLNEVQQLFFTREELLLPAGIDKGSVAMQAKAQGPAGEVADPPDPPLGTWEIQDDTLPVDLVASISESVLLGDFGVISIFVDAPDFENDKETIQQAIDGVRAAGILVILDEVQRLNIGTILRIEIEPTLNLSQEEKIEFENNVATAIKDYLKSLKMGKPLQIAKLLKELLSVENVDNLLDYQFTLKKGDRPATTILFSDSKNKIEVEQFERINPEYVCVASEEKTMEVTIEFQSDSPDLAPQMQDIEDAMTGFFAGLKTGDDVTKADLLPLINGALAPNILLDDATFKLKPKAWCTRPDMILKEGTPEESIAVSIVERAQMGKLFAYNKILQISGALKPILPLNLPIEEKAVIYSNIETEVEAFVDAMGPEDDLVLEDLIPIVSAVDRVLTVEYEEDDFEVAIDGTLDPSRLVEGVIDVQPHEKARITFLCITDGIERLELSLNTLTVDLTVAVAPANNDSENELKTKIKNAYNNFIVAPEFGQDLNYLSLSSALLNLIPSVSYTITELALTGNSLCDDRIQTTDSSTERDIKVRSLEVLQMQTITETDITVNVIVQ